MSVDEIQMTTEDTATPDDTAGAPSQWRGESIQLVNWGNMSGHNVIELDGKSALMTGESGSGKSTVLDAVLALMQASTARFNSASNATGGGRARSGSQRTELTYLTGKLDDFERPDGELVSRSLRPVTDEARWGALAMTFRSTAGERYTIVRAYFVRKGAADRNDVIQRSASVDGPFDLMQLADAAPDRFDVRSVKALGLKPYEGPGPFRDAMFKRLGFGRDGAKVVDLLRRIQSGADVASVDALFSDVVLEEPATFAHSEAVTQTFAGLKASYDEMVATVDKLAVLRPIREHKDEIDRTAAALSDVRALHLDGGPWTPFAMWAAGTERTRRAAELEAVAAQLPIAVEERDSAQRHHAAATGVVDDLKLAMHAQSADLNVLKREADDAERHRDKVIANRGRYTAAVSGLGMTVDSEAEHAALLARSQALADSVEADEEALTEHERSLVERRPDLRKDHERLTREIASLKRRRSRIPERFDTIRNTIAGRLGWEPARLPFIAELIDVPVHHDQWRTAAEAVFGGIGLRLAVPVGEREHFQRAIDDLQIRSRVGFDFVQDHASYVNIHDEARLISRLAFDPDYPFLPWLIERVNRSGGRHLLVDEAVDLAVMDGESRVARSGQVSERVSGAHGGGHERILGFSNLDLIERRESELAAVEAEQEQIAHDLSGVDAQRRALKARRGFLDVIVELPRWDSLDVAAARTALQGLLDRIEELRESSEPLRLLEAELGDAEVKAANASRALHDAQDRHKDLEAAHGSHEARLAALEADLMRLERGELSLTRSQVQMCEEEAVRAGLPDGVDHLSEAIERVRVNLRASVEDLDARHVRAVRALTTAFERYRRQWGDEANDSVEPEAYDWYLVQLEGLEAKRFEEARELWCEETLQWTGADLMLLRDAFRAARTEIATRIHNINDLLETVPFGADEDRLKLDDRRRTPPQVQTWLSELEAVVGNVTDFDAIEDAQARFKAIEARFLRIDALLEPIRPDKGRGTSEDTRRHDLLDVRRHVYITAHRMRGDDRVATYASFAAKSGGETQELTAFITGAALRFRLGAADGSGTTYTPVFLDEGFVKADGKFTGRAVKAWEALGFQLIVAVPVEKFSAMEPYLDRLFVMSKDSTGRGYCDRLTADEVRAQLGVD